MERLLILLGLGLTVCVLAFASLAQIEDTRKDDLAALSAIIPNDPWYQEQVVRSDKPVLVDFTAEWCGICKQMKDVFQELEKNYSQQIRIVSVDIDQHPEVARALHVEGVPTMMFVKKNNQVVAYTGGLVRYETLEKMILAHLKEQSDETPAEEQKTAGDEAAAGEQAVPPSEATPASEAKPAVESAPMAEVAG